MQAIIAEAAYVELESAPEKELGMNEELELGLADLSTVGHA